MSTKKKPRPLRTVLRDAWKLRDELDAAAVRAAGTKARRAPASVREAVEEATRALYLGDLSRDALARLVLRALAPDIDRLVDERGPEAAYDAVRGTEER